jgi:hypothetical protein
VQAQHKDFSDVPLLVPFKSEKGLKLLQLIHQLSLAFIEDRLDEELGKEPHEDKKVYEDKKGKKHLVGKPGEVLVHVP